MACSLTHTRAVGDILSKFAVQLTRGGIAPDLTGKIVNFVMYDSDGAVVVAENDTNVSVVDAANAWVDYDFQAGEVAIAGTFKAFFKVYDALETEPDTYPADEDGITVILFNPAAAITTPEPSIDIIAAANTPLRVRTFEGTVQERTIDELIKADRYAQGQEAIGAVPWGMRIAKTKPPSTLS